MTEEDHCVYIKRQENTFLIRTLFMDNILIVGNDKEMIITIQRWLSSTFEMKDMGQAHYLYFWRT